MSPDVAFWLGVLAMWVTFALDIRLKQKRQERKNRMG